MTQSANQNGSFLMVDGLHKSFVLQNRELKVIDDISFQMAQGDFLTILGPSGCGKSTLIRCIAGLELPSTGNVVVDSEQVTGAGPDRLMVFQDFNQLFQWKTVVGNVIDAVRLVRNGVGKKEARETAEDALRMVHLDKFLDAFPNQLSGGMRQRVAIARALAIHPKVLLMDEPFGALDAQTRAILQKELQSIWQKTGITVIFITHNIQESILMGNRIMVMSQAPAKVKVFHENHLEIPRMPETPEFMELWHHLYNNLEARRFED